MKSRFHRTVGLLILVVAAQQTLQAFDTFWHSAATGAAAREFGFSDQATNIVQFGNFGGPDFFGPLYDTAGGEIVERDYFFNFATLPGNMPAGITY
jgi:hypothetical protein